MFRLLIARITQKSGRLNLVKYNLVLRKAFEFDENVSLNGFPTTPNKVFMQEVLISHASFNFLFIAFLILNQTAFSLHLFCAPQLQKNLFFKFAGFP